MTQTLSSLAVLACPVGMGLMMWLMMRGGRKSSTSSGEQEKELAQLRAEMEQLRATQQYGSGRADSAATHAPR